MKDWLAAPTKWWEHILFVAVIFLLALFVFYTRLGWDVIAQ